MPLKARSVRQALKSKGFAEESRDHRYHFFQHTGKKSNIYTKVSYNQAENRRQSVLGDGSAGQAHWSTVQSTCKLLVNCRGVFRHSRRFGRFVKLSRLGQAATLPCDEYNEKF